MHDNDFSTAQTAVLDRYGIEARERWVPCSGVDGEAHAIVAGTGPPLVLLNGIGVPAAMLAPLVTGCDGFTTYAIDLPGFGLTDTTRGFADDLRVNAVRFLIEVFDMLELERPVVVANSLGSLWSTWLAIDAPDRVAALAHVGCPATAVGTSAPLLMRLLSVRLLGRLMTRLQPPSERQVGRLAELVHEAPLPTEMARLILATEQLDHFEPAFLAMLHGVVRLRGSLPRVALTAEELAHVTVPTLLVFAKDDPMGAAAAGERMAAAMADAELHIVDGGHAPWLHHADQIIAPLAAFLARVELGPPL